MLNLLLRRLAAFVPTLILVVIIAFVLEHIVPGGPAEALIGIDGGGAAAIATINRQLGLNKPLVAQFISYLNHLIHGQLGESYITSTPVRSLIGQRLQPSVELIIGALVVSVIVGGGAGVFSAVKRNSRLGKVILTASGAGLAVPDFWIGALASGIIGVSLALLPPSGYQPISAGLVPNLRTVILPIVVLSIPTSAFICRHLRSGMVAALESPYIRTAWAMGVRPWWIYSRFALRNAVTPLITFLPLVVSGLIGGTVVVEYIFGIPGLGSLIVNATTDRDYVTLQAVVLLIGVVVLVLNLLADLVVFAIDPRSRANTRP